MNQGFRRGSPASGDDRPLVGAWVEVIRRDEVAAQLARLSPGKETNWVETIPGKSWFQLFRLYGPLQLWFAQTWKLNEFEPIV